MEGGVIDVPPRVTETTDSDNDAAALQGCCDPRKPFYRFVGLALMCLLGFGSFFCFDNPAAMQDNFMSDLDLTTTKFVLLYSIYSWPNVIFCFVGGFLLDSTFGIRFGTIIYMAITLVGQLIFALGALLDMFSIMMLGRFVFGIGAESLAVAQNSYAVLWFKGKELNMVFGFQLSFARVGSTVNFLVMEPIYHWVARYYSGYTCTGVVLFLASITCFGSMLCALVLAFMDRRAEKLLKRGEGETPEVVRLADIKDFKGIFWMVTAVVIAYYVAIFPFIALGKVFFIRKYGYSPTSANAVNSLVYAISAIASPLLGYLIDKTGKNVFWVVLSIVGTMMAHALLTFTFVNPYICMIVMGFSYSMVASALWPLIALVIPEYQLGTAYGIAQSIQNLGLAVVSILTGMIVDSGGYFMLEMFFLAWLCVSLLLTIAIWVSDATSTGGYLNMTPRQREIHDGVRKQTESNEREKLLNSGSVSDLSADDLLSPHSDIHIRNRYLSRIGANLPARLTAPTYRVLR